MKKAIVIGAGFGGIASAIRLRKKGYSVEIIDRCNSLGGRAQVFNVNGFKHDAGPTLITAPFLFKELFVLFNKNINDYVKFVPLNPWYRFIFDDKTIFDYERSLTRTISNNVRRKYSLLDRPLDVVPDCHPDFGRGKHAP